MKFKQSLTKQIQIPSEVFEKKIVCYLVKNQYRITEKSLNYIIFVDDEFSDRKGSRSDIYTRIGAGKFIFHSSAEGHTSVKLIYLTSITFPLFIMISMSAFGMYTESIAPVIMSFVFLIPIIIRIFYIKGNVFNEILEC